MMLTEQEVRMALTDARRQVWEEAAKVAETFGVHPALNVWNGGPEWYRHGQDIATAIRAKASQEALTD